MNLRRISSVLVLVPFAGFIIGTLQPARAAAWPDAPRDSLARMRERFLASLGDSASKAGTRFKGEVGATNAGLEKMVRDTVFRLHAYADSLIRSAGDRLSPADQDTLRRLESRFVVTAQSLRSGHGRALEALLGRLAARLEGVRIARARCGNCTAPEHFQDQLSAFMDDADGLAEVLADTAGDVRDSFQDALSDSADACRSALEDAKDRYADLAEQAAEHRSAFVAGVRYTSHFAYRGRDDGLATYALIPSVTYRHSSGVSVNLTRYWMEKAYRQWSETDLGAEYDFDITEEVSAYIAYTRFWFADSSELSRSIFTNSAYAGISWSAPLASLELDVDEDFGTRSQFTAIFTVSFPWTLGAIGPRGRLDFQPAVSAVFGQQLFRSVPVVESPGTGISTGEAVLQGADFFGVVDYEFSLPLTLTLGPVTLMVSGVYDIPVNVIDGSTSTPFFSAAGTVSVAVR